MAVTTTSEEEWRWVPGYEGYYEVSNRGRVRSYNKRAVKGPVDEPQRVLSQSTSTKAYPKVTLNKDGSMETPYVHKLVLEAFRGPCPDGCEASHINGNPKDNRLENLNWETREENNQRKVNQGTQYRPTGEKHHESKLNREEVIQIRMIRKATNLTFKEISTLYPVSETHVGSIVRGEKWGHVPDLK